nr:DUF308 domain-containing protein [uncultured Bacteroides sp.]
MKAINNFLMRSVCALIVGLVVVIWPDVAAVYIVITIGILFMIPGLVVTIGYFTKKASQEVSNRFPIEGVGSFLFGLWLVVMPAFFADVLMLLLGFMLMMGGVQQIGLLIMARKWIQVPGAYYIIPLLILFAGLFVILNPTGVRNTAFIIIGITSLIYALSELIGWLKFMRRKPKPPVAASLLEIEDAEVIEGE